MKTLTKEFPLLQVNKVGPAYTINDSVTGSNWRKLDALPTTRIFIADTYFDLAGMSQQEKTLFFKGAAMQETLLPSVSPATVGDGMIVADIMCTTPITDTEAFQFSLTGNMLGSLSTLTFDQTIYGRIRTFNVDIDNQAGGYAIVLADNQCGSLEATASDRIYCYRVVTMLASADGVLGLYPARYILQADAREEPEYEYLMRLKRSYELQQRADRD